MVVFAYVDDFFWPCPEQQGSGGVSSNWILGLFKAVCSDLLGWVLDPDKQGTGQELTLLGLRISLRPNVSE